MRMLTLDLLGVQMTGAAVEDNLDDCGARAFRTGHTVSARFDARTGNGRRVRVPRECKRMAR